MRSRRFLAVVTLAAILLAAGTGAGADVAASPMVRKADILGDVDCDTNVNSIDTALVPQFEAGLIP